MPADADNVNFFWVGADNTNHYFTPGELFNTSETASFGIHLLDAGTSFFGGTTNSTYDRYTYYRLLSQLGTDTAPESGKMNINYDNLNPYLHGFLDTNGVASTTNFVSWQPLAFFTNAADRLLRAYTTEWRNGNPTNFATNFYSVSDFSPMISNPSLWTNYPAFGLGNIPVLVSNRFVYSSAVNRLLQLAANIYDATTNRFYDNTLPRIPLPTVFQPVFTVTNGNVYITNFVEVTNTSFLGNTILNLGFGPTVVSNLNTHPYDLVFGVPLIIGAKKGFPNFNEFALESAFQLTRKLQVTRTTTNAPITSYQLNQMFNLSVINQLGVECWNSYTNNYTRPVTIMVNDYLSMGLTNDENFSTNTAMTLTNNLIPLPIQPWQGYSPNGPSAAFSFLVPLNTNIAFVPVSTYRYNGGSPYLSTNLNLPFEISGGNYIQPHWGMTMTNLLQVVMVDVNSGRIIDYVQLNGPNRIRDLGAEIQQWCDTAVTNAYLDQWDTNLYNGVPMGVANQISVSLGINPAINPSYWQDPLSATNQVNGFRAFYHVGELPGSPPSSASYYAAGLTSLSNQVPYTPPPATVVLHVTWQANDPLVHYLADDLAGAPYNGTDKTPNWPWPPTVPNDRYLPWGGNPNETGADAQDAYNSALKDPLVRSSDDWDFPVNKFPTVGWLGRVHRGTPWQTVYLKATNIATNSGNLNSGINAWMAWTGNTNIFDAAYNVPVQDWLLFDLFTTAFNDNATRGTLSVNVGPINANLAAWSALFSGIVVPTNTTGRYTFIQPAGPAGSSSLLGGLVANINSTRATFTNSDGLVGTFEHVGDILATPELTVSNQWILLNNSDTINGISDEMYEWLPQQVMSLLRVSDSPRYVIYCYGQTLKPAPDSIYTGSGQYFGMVTNYQVVSEIATRAIVRFNSTVTNVVSMNITNDVLGNPITNWFTVPVVTNNNAVIENFNILPPD